MVKILSKSGEQKLVMVNYVHGFNQSETGKYFEMKNNYSSCTKLEPVCTKSRALQGLLESTKKNGGKPCILWR